MNRVPDLSGESDPFVDVVSKPLAFGCLIPHPHVDVTIQPSPDCVRRHSTHWKLILK